MTAAATSFRQWELENQVKATSNRYHAWDPVKYKQFLAAKPWKSDSKYFKKVFISSLALLKIVAHAKTGQGKAGMISQDKSNWVEVMGMLQGYAFEETVVITDAFALPVVGSEVEASLDERSQAYWVQYQDISSRLRPEGCVGWYHSHPGLYSFMSRTDCRTQQSTQPFNDPWVALVVDPVKSIVTGAVDFGVYRTWPVGESHDADVDLSSVPASKIQEYGTAFRDYYQMEVTVYRSEHDAKLLELLWSRYCVAALSGSPLVANRHFIDGRLERNLGLIGEAEEKVVRSRSHGGTSAARRPSAKKKDEPHPLDQLTKATGGTANEVMQGLLAVLTKEAVFNVPE